MCPQGLAAHTRMTSADSLDVAALRDLKDHDPGDLRIKSCDSASRLRLHTQKIIQDDSCGLVRLSKIAHMRRTRCLSSFFESSRVA